MLVAAAAAADNLWWGHSCQHWRNPAATNLYFLSLLACYPAICWLTFLHISPLCSSFPHNAIILHLLIPSSWHCTTHWCHWASRLTATLSCHQQNNDAAAYHRQTIEFCASQSKNWAQEATKPSRIPWPTSDKRGRPLRKSWQTLWTAVGNSKLRSGDGAARILDVLV